ncbi:conjugal transfer protein [Coprobacillus sp. AF21-8LB]|uniref:conjugal transfer protein n=1 Tax=Streptococcus pasteurianus TaxID=197614 RepID=UPI0002DDB157|nr:conjugal transfer protein [Streptococcus pasteurianus]RHQ85329.1 conjugal transfer protein [Coprobacillus sp. AF21-8LB]
MRSERRRHGLAVAGVASATPAGKTPRYLTGGYKSTGNSQKNIRKSFGYKGFTKFQRMSNGL